MNNAAVVFVFFASQGMQLPVSQDSTAWPMALTASPRYKALSHAQSKNRKAVSSVGPTTISVQVTRETPLWARNDPAPESRESIAARKQATKDWNDAMQDAKLLSRSGNPREAIDRLKGYLATHRKDSASASMLADAAFMVGSPKLAYDTVAPLVATMQSPPILLRASLAASELGEGYKGQKEYCLAVVNFLCGFPKDVQGSLPAGNSPRDLELASLLALAEWGNSDDNDSRLFYAQRALAISPGNPIAADVAAPILRQKGNAKEAVLILRLAVPKSIGMERDVLQRQLDDAETSLAPKVD